MRLCACFLLVNTWIFANTHSSTPTPPIDNNRFVNLALETVLEFNERDKASDIKFLDNVQNFITKVKTVIGKNSNVKTGFRRDFKAPAVDTFTGFLQEVVNILNTFDNTTFIDFFEILDKEVRKYHYRGCKFYELTENNDIRKVIAAKLDLIRRTPASDMKANINTLSETLNNLNYDQNIVEIFEYINSLYRQDSRGKFQKFLTELELHGRSNSQSNTRLGDIIKNGVRSIIFDHYTNLNTNVRRDVKQKIETFWKQFNKNHPSNNIPNARTSNNNMNEVKSPKPGSRKHTANAEVKQFDPKNVGTKRDDPKRDNKRKKLTRKDSIVGPAKVQGKGKNIPSPQQTGATNQQGINIERQQQSSSLSSESLEFYHQSKEDTQQNKTVNSKKISKKTLTKSRKKSEKKPTTKNPTHNTVPNIWIEESTGRLPKEVLDKLSIKARGHNTTQTVSKHAPEHDKTSDKGRKSWHAKMFQPKHDTKRMTKYRSKYDSHYEYMQDSRQKASGNKKLITNKSSKPVHSKPHKYKKSKGPTRVESNKTNRSSPDTSKTLKFLDVLDVLKKPVKSGKTVKPLRGTVTKKGAALSRTKRVKYDKVRRMKAFPRTSTDLAAQKQQSKKKKTSRKSGKQFETILDHPLSSSEGVTVEKMEIKKGKTTEYQSEQKEKSLEKDLYLIRKIKNLEKEIEEVKSRINDKAEVKLSESKEIKEMRSLSETMTGSDVNNDPKIGKIETLGTVDDKNKPMFMLTNKDVEKLSSKSKGVKDNNENGTRNNADVVKVRELQQSTESSNAKRTLSIAKPLVNRSIIDSAPRQDKLQIKETLRSKNGSVIPNQYVQNLFSKYKKIMEGLNKGKSKMNANADVDKEKENISEFAVTGTAKTAKQVLIDSVTDKDSKNIVESKKFEPFFRAETNIIPNGIIERKDKTKVTRITDDLKNIIEKDSKNNKTKINYFESARDGLLDMTKIANNKKEIFDNTVSVSDFKSIDKDKKPESIFRSDVNLITNDYKDETDVAKDINNIFKNNEKIKTVRGYNVNADLNDEIKELQQSTEPSKIKRKLVKAKPRLLIESFTIPGVELIQIPGAVNKTEFRMKNTFFQNEAFNEKKKTKNNIRTAALYESKFEHTYEPQQTEEPDVQELVTLSEKDAEKMYKDLERKKNKLLTKRKSNKSFKVRELNTKVNNIHQGVKPDTNHGSDVNETSINVLHGTENTKVIEKTDSNTATIQNISSTTKGNTVSNNFQNITVTKEQSPIIQGDNKTEVTLNIGVVTPEAKRAETEIRYRAPYDASIGAEAAITEIESTSTPAKTTESSKGAGMTAVTTPSILELSTIEVVFPSIPSQSWRTSISGF